MFTGRSHHRAHRGPFLSLSAVPLARASRPCHQHERHPFGEAEHRNMFLNMTTEPAASSRRLRSPQHVQMERRINVWPTDQLESGRDDSRFAQCRNDKCKHGRSCRAHHYSREQVTACGDTYKSTDHFNSKNDTTIKIKAGDTKLLPIHVANGTSSFLLTSHCKLDERRSDNSGMTATYKTAPKLVEVIDDKLTNADLCRLKATF